MAKRKKPGRGRKKVPDAPLQPEVLPPARDQEEFGPGEEEAAAPLPVTPIDPAEIEGAVEPAPAGFTEAAGASEKGVILRPDALQRYFADIRGSKPLSREEEHALAVRYAEYGDLDAAHALVMANLRLVVKIAMEYHSVYMNLLDLIQEGNIGLMEAVKRFNPYKEVKLSTYAAWWIRAFILRYLINNFRLVKIGTTRAQRKLFFNLNKERRRLEAMGYDPTPRLLASRLDVREKDVVEMSARMAQPAASLDQPAGAEGQATLLDFMAGESESPEALVAREETRRRALSIIMDLAESLPEKERAILDRRLLAEEPETLEQIGDTFGITKERVRQLEVRLRNRLKETLRARLMPGP
ncbi:MAG: RNA polymerase sigma factor RpoD/SigA [Myxococcota bacterium]